MPIPKDTSFGIGFFLCLFLLCGCHQKEEENQFPLIECGGLAICEAAWEKSNLPEFVGVWKNQDSADSCNQITTTYIFNDTVRTIFEYKQVSSCNTVSLDYLYFKWYLDLDSGEFCESNIYTSPITTNCYSYSINSTDLTIDSKVYTKQ